MLYLLLFLTAVLLVLNLYASRLILRSKLNDAFEQKAQLVLVWIIPFLGAAFTIHVLKESFRSPWFGRGHSGIEPEQAWYGRGNGQDCAPGDGDCGE